LLAYPSLTGDIFQDLWCGYIDIYLQPSSLCSFLELQVLILEFWCIFSMHEVRHVERMARFNRKQGGGEGGGEGPFLASCTFW